MTKRLLSILITLGLCLSFGACAKDNEAESKAPHSKDHISAESAEVENNEGSASEETKNEASEEEESVDVTTDTSENTPQSKPESKPDNKPEDKPESKPNENPDDTSDSTADDTPNDASSEADDTSELPPTEYEKQYFGFTPRYICTGFNDEKSYPYAVTITSSAELTSYYLANKSALGLGEEFKKAISAYDVEFFENKVLVFAVLKENGGSIRHEVKEVFLQDGKLNIDIERIVPEASSMDMTGWHIVIELDKACLVDEDDIVINVSK